MEFNLFIYFTDAVSKNPTAINPTYVMAVYNGTNGEELGKTIIRFTNGTLAVEESQVEVVGRLQGCLMW